MKINKKILVFATIILSCVSLYIKSAKAAITVAEAFYALAHQNNTQKIENLLYKGYSLESTDARGYNPVCLSVIKNDQVAYRNLTAYGANKKPECLKKIPASAYHRFFGEYPKTATTPQYVPDTPYLIGTAALAAGAVTAAYLLRGDTDGGSKEGDGGEGSGGDDKPNPNPDPDKPVIDPTNCPPNSTYSSLTKKCECNVGYEHFGDEKLCYAKIDNCSSQKKNKCNACAGNYVLKDNVCYAPIPFCAKQNGNKCEKCEGGYGTHNGNGSTCYVDILYCTEQEQDVCKKCKTGYGTHGDSHNCYVNIDHCEDGQQIQTACRLCKPGYDTYGDPNADMCYPTNVCESYNDPGTVPTDKGSRCICNTNKGYEGEPGSCKQAEDKNYREGDGVYDVWNNLNERFCNSHGVYIDLGDGNWKCNCYPGYDNASRTCDICDKANGYDNFGSENACYRNINCEKTYGEGFTQRGNACVCKEGYFSYENQCFKPAQCTKYQVQVKDATEPDACQCKPNFNEECTACINDNFILDEDTGTCIPKDCPEKWAGAMCDICPSQYQITTDEDGEFHCGLQCAENRKPIEQNNDACSICADGYRESGLYGTCIVDGCSQGVEGFVVIRDQCVCNEAEGYVMSIEGTCVKKGEDYIGLSNSNVNNGELILENDGEYRDVYGMKPFIETGEGDDKNITYYDKVYNAYSTKGSQTGTIDITNKNTGNIDVYGIYSPSEISNASVVNLGKQNASAIGRIIIKDSNSLADIYGIYSDSQDNVYNGFAYTESDGELNFPVKSNVKSDIIITKDRTTLKDVIGGEVIGIHGGGHVYNAFANTNKGSAANVQSVASITITNEGMGATVGIDATGANKKVNNAFSFMNSAVSDSEAEGKITLNGGGDVYGIRSNSTVANSETQFNRSFNKIGKFVSKGTIDVTTNSRTHAAYGIRLNDAGNQKSEIYNAIGYNSKGTIIANNADGGSAYGIYSNAATYQDKDEEGNPVIDDDGNQVVVYNNTYNAFRSSERYGGDNVEAEGNITVNISGGPSYDTHKAIGIYSTGNVFNAYANSGSDVKLESVGKITVNDVSGTANVNIRGIEGGGATIANAYAMGQNKNISTIVKGDIDINISGLKTGEIGNAAGIYSDSKITQNAHIYNAGLVKDRSNVIGNINVKSPDTTNAMSKMYGIYAASIGSEAQQKSVYNAYYENNDGISGGSVHGTINVKAETATRANNGEYYGIYVNNGSAYNAYSTAEDADVVGIINVEAYGAQEKSIVAGMYGINNAILNNSGKSTINVTSHSDKSVAYGMYGDNARIYNDAKLNVKNERSDAYGIYINGGVATNDIHGEIVVNGGGNNYGIYAKSDEETTTRVYNNGDIFVSGGNNIGIYGTGEKTIVQNTGTIALNTKDNSCKGEDCFNNSFIVLENDATFENAGKVTSTASLNFDAMGGNIVLAKNGKFEATENIAGTLNVSTDVVKNNFNKTTYVEDALSAENVNDVNLVSKSYLYNGKLEQNEKGAYDVVMQMKDFSEVTDGNKAQYLNTNYSNEKNMVLFDTLRSASTQKEQDQIIADTYGTSTLPNMTMENLKVQRSLDRNMVSELFKEGDDVRKIVGGDALFTGRDTHGTLTGYDLNSQSMYALYDKKLDNRYRLGLGMSFTHMNTDYNNDSTRKNFMVQGYVPFTYNNGKGLTAVSMARLGFSDGDYSRRSLGKTYKADTNDISYGLVNEARYTMNVGGVNVTPYIGLNAMGWYQDEIKEGKEDLALSMDSSNIFSLESALGLYLDKEIEFNQESKLNMALGIGYYHEFADPYKGVNAHHYSSIGRYKLRDTEHLNSRNRGILSAKVNYDYKDFAIYGELLQYLEKEYPLDIDVGLKYKF